MTIYDYYLHVKNEIDKFQSESIAEVNHLDIELKTNHHIVQIIMEAISASPEINQKIRNRLTKYIKEIDLPLVGIKEYNDKINIASYKTPKDLLYVLNERVKIKDVCNRYETNSPIKTEYFELNEKLLNPFTKPYNTNTITNSHESILDLYYDNNSTISKLELTYVSMPTLLKHNVNYTIEDETSPIYYNKVNMDTFVDPYNFNILKDIVVNDFKRSFLPFQQTPSKK